MHDHHQKEPVNHHPRPLWAPWRIDYIRGPKDDDCFICQAAQDTEDQSNLVIARGDKIFLLLNAFPYNSGHVLIAPYRHIPDLADLTGDELNEIMHLTVRMKAVLTRVMKPEGFNFGFNLGHAAGAGLESHLHGHIVPRWVGDVNFMPVLGNTRVVPESLDATAAILREAWDETDDEAGAKPQTKKCRTEK